MPKKKRKETNKAPDSVSKYELKDKRVRARNSKGHFIADNPDTPENEAWVTKVVKKVKSVRKPRKKKND